MEFDTEQKGRLIQEPRGDSKYQFTSSTTGLTKPVPNSLVTSLLRANVPVLKVALIATLAELEPGVVSITGLRQPAPARMNARSRADHKSTE